MVELTKISTTETLLDGLLINIVIESKVLLWYKTMVAEHFLGLPSITFLSQEVESLKFILKWAHRINIYFLALVRIGFVLLLEQAPLYQ